MSATLQTIHGFTGASTAAAEKPRVFGRALSRSAAGIRDFVAESTAYELIEGSALITAAGAATVMLLSAFGLDIGAN